MLLQREVEQVPLSLEAIVLPVALVEHAAVAVHERAEPVFAKLLRAAPRSSAYSPTLLSDLPLVEDIVLVLHNAELLAASTRPHLVLDLP